MKVINKLPQLLQSEAAEITRAGQMRLQRMLIDAASSLIAKLFPLSLCNKSIEFVFFIWFARESFVK